MSQSPVHSRTDSFCIGASPRRATSMTPTQGSGQYRLSSMSGASNLYNGAGQRVQQTVGGNVTQYLLDVQPGLWQVWASTTGGNTTRQVFGPMGIQSIQQPGGAWQHVIPDALGSVRGVVNVNNAILDARLYSPYGDQTQRVTTPGNFAPGSPSWRAGVGAPGSPPKPEW